MDDFDKLKLKARHFVNHSDICICIYIYMFFIHTVFLHTFMCILFLERPREHNFHLDNS